MIRRRCDHIHIAVAGVLAFALNLVLIPVVIRFSRRYGAYDTPGYRKLHAEPVPHLGGVGIVFSFLIAGAAGYLMLARSGAAGELLPWRDGLVIGGLVLTHVIGVLDDALDVHAFRKLLLQFIPAGVIVAGGLVIERVGFLPAGPAVELGIFAAPVTVLWIVGVSTAVNLIDGMDGFAGGITLVAAAAFCILAVAGGAPVSAMAACALAGAVFGFLRFNLPPARIFMGDGGSLFAGAFLAALAVTATGAEGGTMSILVAPVILAVPLIDVFAAVLRRARRQVPLHEPDREHIHHLLLHRFGSVPRALAAGFPMAALAAAGAVILVLVDGTVGTILAVAAPLALIVMVARLDSRARRQLEAGAGRIRVLPAAQAGPEARRAHGFASRK